jgi:hypothetical protein
MCEETEKEIIESMDRSKQKCADTERQNIEANMKEKNHCILQCV